MDSNGFSQLNQTLRHLEEESDGFDLKQWDQSFQNKTKEMHVLIKEMKRWNKEKAKKTLETECVEKAIMKANSNISRAEDRSEDIQKYINKLSKKVDDNKENVVNVMNVWNIVGLRIEKMDQMFNIMFNKISETDPNKWFSVKITLEDNQMKVVECDPKDSMDSKAIEEEFKSRTDGSKVDLRHLIVLIRNSLKKRNFK